MDKRNYYNLLSARKSARCYGSAATNRSRSSLGRRWRGKYDHVIHRYAEVSPLEPEEWELLSPLWWAFLIDVTCQDMRNGIRDDGWTIRKLLQRFRLMGPDSAEFR